MHIIYENETSKTNPNGSPTTRNATSSTSALNNISSAHANTGFVKYYQGEFNVIIKLLHKYIPQKCDKYVIELKCIHYKKVFSTANLNSCDNRQHSPDLQRAPE